MPICPKGAKYGSPGQGQASAAKIGRRPGFTITTNPRPSVPLCQREKRNRGRNRVRPDFVLGPTPSVGHIYQGHRIKTWMNNSQAACLCQG